MTILAPLIFALADFITGRDYFSKLKIPGRSIWYIGPALFLILWPMSHAIAFLSIGWSLWRSVLGWSTFGGRIDIKTPDDFKEIMLRNTVSIVPTMIISILLGFHDISFTIGAWLAFSLLAAMPNVWYGYMTGKGKDVGPIVDALHGGIFGLICLLLFHGPL